MKSWVYVENPFLNGCDSFIKGMNISTYHDSTLFSHKNDPFIQSLYDEYHPLHLKYVENYDHWKLSENLSKGPLKEENDLLELLRSKKIQEWDVAIQGVYPQYTPEYTALLPNRRIPFQQGAKMLRTESLFALSMAIGDDPQLKDVKKDIDEFCQELRESTKRKDQAHFTIREDSNNLQKALEAICLSQFANLGALIHRYPNQPNAILVYFDLKTLRRKRQTLFTGHLKPGEMHIIAKHSFLSTDEVILTNLSHAELTFYLCQMKGDQPGDIAISMGQGEQQVVAQMLGNLSDPFFTVLNSNPDITAEFRVKIV